MFDAHSEGQPGMRGQLHQIVNWDKNDAAACQVLTVWAIPVQLAVA
jgi:hypothetical protein